MAKTLHLTLLAALITAAAAGCPSPEWKQFRDSCYWSSDYGLRWIDVANVCDMFEPGSDMVSVHDIELDAFLAQEVLDGKEAWLGLRRASNSSPFTWTDGSPMDFSMWYGGDPDHDGEACGSINWKWGNIGDWTGHSCYQNDKHVNVTFMCRIVATN